MEKSDAKKRRDMLILDGVDAETKEKLAQLAEQKYGKKNVSMLVRELIAQELNKGRVNKIPDVDLTSPMQRVEIRLPKSCFEKVTELADSQFSTPHYFIASLVYERLGVGQLQGNEIEVLRKSNYELAKIGTNINQIAKAFNILVAAQGAGELPEVSKRMAALKKDIDTHTKKVLALLETKTIIWETKGRGSNSKRKK